MNDTREALSTDELIALLRFQQLDARNGAIAGEPDAIRICGAAADEIERLRGIVTRQRRELRRLNKTLRSIWEGVRFSTNTRAAQLARTSSDTRRVTP